MMVDEVNGKTGPDAKIAFTYMETAANVVIKLYKSKFGALFHVDLAFQQRLRM